MIPDIKRSELLPFLIISMSILWASVVMAQNRVVVIPLMEDAITCSGTLVGTRWCNNGDGTVTDMTTGLVWLRDASWGGTRPWRINSSCGGVDYSCLNDAHARAGILYSGAAGTNLSDGSVRGDWRLPTKTELYQLANGVEAVRDTTMRAFIGVQYSYYWSSTTYATEIQDAWIVHLGSGGSAIDLKTVYYWVWPVRNSTN